MAESARLTLENIVCELIIPAVYTDIAWKEKLTYKNVNSAVLESWKILLF
jgi:hypothetical protein